MRGGGAIRSVERMNIALFLVLMAGPIISAVITATTANKTNERYRARRAAKIAAKQV
jgi:hypothetical protein